MIVRLYFSNLLKYAVGLQGNRWGIDLKTQRRWRRTDVAAPSTTTAFPYTPIHTLVSHPGCNMKRFLATKIIL